MTTPQIGPEATANALVAGRLRATMAMKNLSAVDVAAKFHADAGMTRLDPKWVQRRAAGAVQMTLSDVQLLAWLLEVPVGDLLVDLQP